MSEAKAPRWQNTRVLWSLVRPYRPTLLLGWVLGLGMTGATLATPMVTKLVLDGLSANEPILPTVGLLVGLLIIGAVLCVTQWILLGNLAQRIVLDARSTMVRKLFRVRLSELSNRSSGEMVTRVTSDTVLLREAATDSLVNFPNGLIALAGALVMMGLLDWVLLAATILVLVLVGGVVGILMAPLADAQREVQAAVGRLGGILEGALRAIRTVKASRAETRESGRVLAHAEESARQAVRAVRIESVAWTAASWGIQLAILLVLALGAWRVSEGAMPVSSLVAFLLYAFQVMDPVTTLTRTFTALQAGLAAASRINEVQNLAVEPNEPPAKAPEPVVAAPVLSFREVTARYAPGANAALDRVSLDIPRHGHTAIVGPSGSGKTTMFSLMLRFLQPERGEIALDGAAYADWSLEEVRRRIVYVEQDTPLVPGTLRENLTYTHPEATEEELWTALEAVQLAEKVRGLPEGLDSNLSGSAVSGGERQRIALARALVSDPEILLLDEATAQLDGLTEAAVQEVIGRIAERGAVVTIAHRLSTVLDADQILVLEKGRKRALGTHAELLAADELYRDLVAALRIAPTAATTAA